MLFKPCELEGNTQWISSEDCIRLFESALKHEPIIDRTITTYRLANCPYPVIARCLNQAIDKVGANIKDATYLEVTKLLKVFHSHIVEESESILHESLVKIIKYNDSFSNCMHTLKYLPILSVANRNLRFTRGTDPNKEQFAWLRERHRSILNNIRNSLSVRDFILS